MGKFTLQVKDKDLTEKNNTTNNTTNNTNALKILTYIMYYVYYNTFEDPLNNHLIERLSDVPSEKSSPSFNITILNMLNNGNKNIKGDDAESNVYSEIIDILSKNISNDLERDLFKNLRATALKDAISKMKDRLKSIKSDSNSGSNSVLDESVIARQNAELYKTQTAIFNRLLKEQEYIYIIYALRTVNDVIDKHNDGLFLKEKSENDKIIKEYNNKPKPDWWSSWDTYFHS